MLVTINFKFLCWNKLGKYIGQTISFLWNIDLEFTPFLNNMVELFLNTKTRCVDQIIVKYLSSL